MPEFPPQRVDTPSHATRGLMSRRQWLATSASAVLGGALLAGQGVGSGAPKAAAISIATPRLPRSQPNLVVYLADSLRADHLGCYGHPVATSPQIDAFSRDSLVFEHCVAQSSWTKPSMASLFTGVVPRVHQAGLSQWKLEDLDELPVQIMRGNLTTLAEALKSGGYTTAFFACNPHIQKHFGFARGFDVYEFKEAWTPEDQTDAVIEWLSSEPPEPFFLMVHEIDPHDPYVPDVRDFVRLFGDRPHALARRLPGADRKLLEPLYPSSGAMPQGCGDYRVQLQALSPAGRGYLARLYDAEIRGVDREFGRVLGALRRQGYADRTAIALTSDHGEAFGEHNSFFHANSLYGEEIHVPLVLRLPGGIRRGRIPWSIGLFDLYPTLLTLAGIEVPRYVQGRTLVHADGEISRYAPRMLWSDLDGGNADLDMWDSALHMGPWKVMKQNKAAHTAVHHRILDPEEKHNLLLKGSPLQTQAQHMVRVYEECLERHTRLGKAFGDPAWTSTADDYREQIESLGYL